MSAISVLRSRMKIMRQSLSIKEQTDAAAAFWSLLSASSFLDAATHIAVYLAQGGELNLQITIEALWRQNKRLYLPSLQEQKLIFKPYQPHTPLKSNRFGILEVETGPAFPAEQLDLVLVPLIAFDTACHRIGMGKGYYDHTFAFRKQLLDPKPFLLGCAYDFQEQSLFTPATHDVSMDAILTPTQKKFPAAASASREILRLIK